MSKARTRAMSCFYCGALISRGEVELDHFPIPESCGGIQTVPACRTCHDMKDRFSLESWISSENGWIGAVLSDFPSMRRETRIFLAKVAALAAQGIKAERDRAKSSPLHPPGTPGNTPTQAD